MLSGYTAGHIFFEQLEFLMLYERFPNIIVSKFEISFCSVYCYTEQNDIEQRI